MVGIFAAFVFEEEENLCDVEEAIVEGPAGADCTEMVEVAVEDGGAVADGTVGTGACGSTSVCVFDCDCECECDFD
jgi:hypothetical protein